MDKRLPILFVLENNQWAVCSHVSTRHPCEALYHHVDPELLFSAKVDGNDVIAVYDAAGLAIEQIRSGNGPAFIDCDTYRLRGHNGAGTDAKLGHRSDEEIASWEAKCPLVRFRDYLVQEEMISRSELDVMESEIEREIDEAFVFAKAGPLPPAEDLLLNVYRE